MMTDKPSKGFKLLDKMGSIDIDPPLDNKGIEKRVLRTKKFYILSKLWITYPK